MLVKHVSEEQQEKTTPQFLIYTSKASEMVWGQIIPLFLLTILYGVHCGLFKPKCSEGTCQCGGTATITCDLTHPLEEFALKYQDRYLFHNEWMEKEGSTENGTIAIEWTEDKVKVTISKVMLSDSLKYSLTMVAKESKGLYDQGVTIKVSGICEPEISVNRETEELVCKAESDINTSIVWMDSHGKLLEATRMETELLNVGYWLRSSLTSMEKIKDEKICCSVLYQVDNIVHTEKKSCVSNTWVFDPKCSEETCQCGETVTVTCTPSHPLEEVILIYQNEALLHGAFLKKMLVTKDKDIGIEWTEHKVKVSISRVTFSDTRKYSLTLVAKESRGYYEEPIAIKVSGLCEPEISTNFETKVLQCEAESEQSAPIVWMNNHRTLHQATRTMEPEQLDTGYKIRSSLRLTEEIGDDICCSVSYRIDGVNTEKTSCMPSTSARDSEEPPSSKNPTLSAVLVLLAVALIAAAFGYLLKRRNRVIVREAPGEQNPTKPETV